MLSFSISEILNQTNLLFIDYFSTYSSIYLVNNKKPRNFGRRRGFALKRDKYETKAYTQSNDTYSISTPNDDRSSPIRLESHIHQPQRI